MDNVEDKTWSGSHELVHPTHAIFPKDDDIKQDNPQQLQESNHEVVEPVEYDQSDGMGQLLKPEFIIYEYGTIELK